MEQKVKFISASSFPLKKGMQIKEHRHIYYQLYYILTGNPVFVVDGNEIHARPGTLFYIPPNTLHRMLPLRDEELECWEFKVQINDPFITGNLKAVSPLMKGEGYVEDMVSYIFDNWKNKVPQNIENIETVFSALFLGFFVRDLQGERDMVCRIRTDSDNVIARRIVAYVGEHFKEEFSLKTLSEELNYNASYLSAVFTRSTGISVVDFLNLYRVRISISLIVFYSSDIFSASEFVGFTNASHFSRTFKKFVGVSPRKFKYVFSNVDRDKIQYLFTDEPVLNGGVCTIDEAMRSMRSIGAEVERIMEQQSGSKQEE